MTEILFFLTAFVAEVIGTIVGFGSSTIFLPLALFFVDFRTALVLVAFSHIFGNIGRITFFRKGLDKRTLLVFGVPSVLLTIAGALVVNYVSQDLLKLALGIFLCLFSLISLVKPNVTLKPSVITATVGGGISGFLAGLVGTGGALRGAFLTAFNLKKEKYLATAAFIALAVDFTRIPIYLRGGFLRSQYYFYLPILLLIALIGSYIGKRLVEKIPAKRFRTGVLIAILLISVKFLYEGIIALN